MRFIRLLIEIEAINFEFPFLHIKFLLWYPLDVKRHIIREAENAIVFRELLIHLAAINFINTQVLESLVVEVSPLLEAQK